MAKIPEGTKTKLREIAQRIKKKETFTGKQKEKIKIQDEKDMANVQGAKAGGRIGLKAGSKGCKLAKRGRGRAYGKNS